MNQLAEVVKLGPNEEAERLWQGALSAFERADGSLISLCEAVDLGVRAAEILAVNRLQPVSESFPATIGLLLKSPPAEVDVHRDAVTVPKTLQFNEVLDLLSEESLECVGPSLHRGWEDRRFSCRRSRQTAQAVIGLSLKADARERLLALAAYRNRIFRLPPPVEIVPDALRDGFTALTELVVALSER